MKTWMSALALTVAGAMLATSAFAQSGSASGASGSATGSSSGTGTTGSSTGGSGSSTDTKTPATGSTKSPSASPSSSTDTKSPGASSSSSSDMKTDSAMKSGKSGRAAAGGSAEQVKAVQQALKDKGHDPGEVDGKMGPKTQAALRDYQQKEGLKATGRLDSETASKLGVQAKADTSSSPAASPSGAKPQTK